MHGRWLVALGLVLAIFAVYGEVWHHEFLNYDDHVSIVMNPNLTGGFSLESAKRAFAAPRFYNYIPLTAVSLQLDHSLHGMEPAGFLLTNVALHAATCVVLFFALGALTGGWAPSAFAAGVFAVHPLHVESVAWATERKDVLSGLFFALGLLAWAMYTRRPSPARYAAVAASFALGLLAKPSVVTFPCVLLLLDWWPLGRLRDARTAGRLLLEKLPLFAIAAGAAAITYAVQQAAGGVSSAATLPFDLRALNALESYSIYVWKTLWPSGLAVFYPHPRDAVSGLHAALAGLAIVGISLAVLRAGRTRGYLAVGWFWYLGTLVPVIGLVQAGMQARADRYMYWPLAGLAIAVAFGLTDLAGQRRGARRGLALAGLALLLVLGIAAHRQVGYWRDTRSLFERALAVTEGNFVAHGGLALVHHQAGRYPEAITHYRQAIELHPTWANPRIGLGDSLLRTGDRAAALRSYREALAIDPDDARAHTQLASALAEGGEYADALEHLRSARALQPDIGVAVVESNLGVMLLQLHRPQEAEAHFRRALEIDPAHGTARTGLAATQLALGDAAASAGYWAAAITRQREALALRPGWIAAANNLAWLLATVPQPDLRAPDEAVALVETALATGAARDPALLDTLAAAHAAAGRFDRAVRVAEEALALAAGSPTMAAEIRARLALYAEGRAYLMPAPAAPTTSRRMPARG